MSFYELYLMLDRQHNFLSYLASAEANCFILYRFFKLKHIPKGIVKCFVIILVLVFNGLSVVYHTFQLITKGLPREFRA